MNYREKTEQSKNFKENYIESLNAVIKRRAQECAVKRNEYAEDIFNNQEKYREELKKMLGWPLVDYATNGLPEVVSEKLSQEDGYTVYRMHIEILEGLKLTGLFFKVNGEEQRPLVIVQHGGWGTPELISGVYGGTANYNDMLQRVRKQCVHVFAPQLLLWNVDEYQVEYNRVEIDARLKRVGSSIAAIEIYGIMRVLDYFETQKHVSSFGMVGLSYGGFYTLYTAAVDTRIKAGISCGWFSERDRYPREDWTWLDSAEKFDDAEVACLIYPRKLCIEIGSHDEHFCCSYGEASFERLKELCRDVGTEWVKLKVFDGNHEFCKDDEPIDELVEELKAIITSSGGK